MAHISISRYSNCNARFGLLGFQGVQDSGSGAEVSGTVGLKA